MAISETKIYHSWFKQQAVITHNVRLSAACDTASGLLAAGRPFKHRIVNSSLDRTKQLWWSVSHHVTALWRPVSIPPRHSSDHWSVSHYVTALTTGQYPTMSQLCDTRCCAHSHFNSPEPAMSLNLWFISQKLQVVLITVDAWSLIRRLIL